MRFLLPTTALILFLSACSGEQKTIEEIQSFEHQDIPVVDKMKQAISLEYLATIGLDEAAHKYLKNYYSARNYEPNWINDSTISEKGQAFKEVMQKNYVLGIPINRIKYQKTENYIQDEIWLTVACSQTIHDLKNGILNYETKEKKDLSFCKTDCIIELDSFNIKSDLREQFINFGPKEDTSYRVLSKGLIEFTDNYPLDTATFEVRSIKYDSTLALDKARVALVSKGYLTEDIKDSLRITEALTLFQKHNGLKPDGVIGKYTSQSLNESSYRKVERIILALDKIRSKRQFPEKYIHINIPEYKLRFYINDSLKSDHNIVVGKYENQTPELESKLRKIVVYPYWNVPYSISSKEILPATRYNSKYLVKHDYKIYKKGEEVDPETVNWRSIRQNAFPFRVVQQPGPRNSLGIIKFDFYNEHSVYFHDTPSKGLFGADVRAYSHGCMRTQNPGDLAKAILARDTIPYRGNPVKADTLDSLFARAENHIIKLVEPIPIYVDYVSVVRQKEDMIVYLDIYGRDEEYLKILREQID